MDGLERKIPLKWMITSGTPISGSLHFHHDCFREASAKGAESAVSLQILGIGLAAPWWRMVSLSLPRSPID